MPPVPVSVAVAAEESVPVEIRAIGTVEPSSTVQIKSQVAGELMSVHFTEGRDVHKDDLLFEIDPRPYRDALAQAEAAVAKDRAQLAQAQANLARDKRAGQERGSRRPPLRGAGQGRRRLARCRPPSSAPPPMPRSESVRADQAAIESARASLESDQAAVERAKLDLSYCEIRSPVTGRAGNLLVHAGNLIKVNDVALVVINQIAPIFVSLSACRRSNWALSGSSARAKPCGAGASHDDARSRPLAAGSDRDRQHRGLQHRDHSAESHLR